MPQRKAPCGRWFAAQFQRHFSMPASYVRCRGLSRVRNPSVWNSAVAGRAGERLFVNTKDRSTAWAAMSLLTLLAKGPTEPPAPGQRGAGGASKSDGSVHDFSDSPVKQNDPLTAETVSCRQVLRALLSDLHDALAQLLVGSAPGLEAHLGISINRATGVVEPIMRQTATFPWRLISVKPCDRWKRR